MDIHTSIERITPAQAERYLERNDNNRTMRPIHVAKLADDISSGRWHVNGSSIVFNGDGTLLDGQHRLAAIVQAGVPIDMVVVRGVSKAAMPTIDANISRKASDVAKLRGYSNVSQLIGTARLLVSAKTGVVREGEKISTGGLMDFLRKHPHLEDSVAASFKNSKTVPVASVAAWHYIAFYIGGFHDEVNAAMKVLDTGIPHYPSDAIHVFRERYLKDRHIMQGHMTKRLAGFWTLVNAWNDFRSRQPRSLCRIQNSEVLIDGVDYDKL